MENQIKKRKKVKKKNENLEKEKENQKKRKFRTEKRKFREKNENQLMNYCLRKYFPSIWKEE